MNWFVKFEGEGHKSQFSGMEEWGEVYSIIEAKSNNEFDLEDFDATFIGFFLNKSHADLIAKLHNDSLIA